MNIKAAIDYHNHVLQLCIVFIECNKQKHLGRHVHDATFSLLESTTFFTQ